MQAPDYDTNTYIALTLAPASSYLTNPTALSSLHPLITYVGPVGSLPDVRLVSVPKREWESDRGKDVRRALEGGEGVMRLDVQQARRRAKRADEEL